MRLSKVFGFAVAAALLLSTSMATAASEEKPQFQWQRPTVIGNAPTGRHGNTATLVGNEMFVIGGCENDITCFSDISLYNTESHRWEVIYSDREHARISPLNRENNIVIPPRGYHTATAVKTPAVNKDDAEKTKIYVFGGHSADGFRSDLFILDPASKAWSKPLVAGAIPSDRSGHSAALYKDRILVFGGNSDDGFLNDLWQYDTKLNAWTKLTTTGVAVPRMGYHSASVVGKYMWVIGGRNDKEVLGKDVYVLDLELLSWSKPLIRGMGPSRRFGANAAVRKDRYIFLTGGCDISIGKCYDDQFILDTAQQTWVRAMSPAAAVVDTSVLKAVDAPTVQANATKPTLAFAAKPPKVVPSVAPVASFLELEESVEVHADADVDAEEEMDADAEAEATFDAEAEEEVDAEEAEEAEEVSFLEINTDLAQSSLAPTHGVVRKGNTLFLAAGADLDAYFANNRVEIVAEKSNHAVAHENKRGELSFADAAPAAAPAAPAAPATPAPAAAPAPAAPAAPAAPVNATAPANVTAPAVALVANVTAPVNATAAVNATVPVVNATVTVNSILQQSNITVPAQVANTTDIVPPNAVNNSTLPKILGLKHLVDAAIAKQKLKEEVDKEHKENTERIKAVEFVPIFKNHAGSDFVGSFNDAGDKLILFGGCGIMDVKCGEGVIVMHVDPETEFQIGLF